MKKKLLQLLEDKKKILDKMKKDDEAGDQAGFDRDLQEMEDLDEKIKRVKTMVDAEENAVALPHPQAPSSRESVRAFCGCIRARANDDITQYMENKAVLQRIIQNDALKEGTPADGGLIVPTDIQTMIHEEMRALSPLSDLFNVENVSTYTGSRVIDAMPTKGFTEVSEMGNIAKDDKPQFKKIEFTIKDYALIVPVSNDLLADTDVALMTYLAKWLGKKQVMTENTILLNILKELDGGAEAIATPADAIKTIKKLINTMLDPAFSANAEILTNQSGFQFLDTLEDTTGRPLLQPDPVDRTQYRLMGRKTVVVSDAVLPNQTTAPIYIGSFAAYGTLFRRQPMLIDATRVGGNAWGTNSTEVRAITRLAASKFDEKAVVAGKITIDG